MIKIEKNEKMVEAIKRVKTVRPMVRYQGDRTYTVSGRTGATYTVKFVVKEKVRLAECNCKAGQTGMLCYHVAAAAGVNIAIQSAKRNAEKTSAPAPTKPQPTRTAPLLIKPQPAGLRINGFDL